jgi:8-oxo-dGTP diphosphatase
LSADRPTQVGIAVVRRADRFLVGQRPSGTVYAGYWEFPGGKCEPAEDPASAAGRECLEETGLRVVVERLRRTVTHRYQHGLVELYFFDCRAENDTAQPTAGSGYCWVRAEDLSALRFPEANEVIVDELAREITGSDSG